MSQNQQKPGKTLVPSLARRFDSVASTIAQNCANARTATDGRASTAEVHVDVVIVAEVWNRPAVESNPHAWVVIIPAIATGVKFDSERKHAPN
jgi:hypothetical protein